MLKIQKEKIRFFEKKITDFFHKAGREHLPWRKKKISAYEVWVSEVMLQQTQVSRVIAYYVRFLQRFSTVEHLAQASWEEFLPYYQGLGYYTRGRNMLQTAQKVVKEHGGKFPREKKVLEELPGIGPYTAAAIMSFAYGDNHLAWDTNLKRVIGRFFFGTKNFLRHPDPALAGEGSDNQKNKRDSSTTLGMTERIEFALSLPAKTLNAALMDFGSALCVSRPKCEACSLRSQCVYYKEKGVQESRIKNRESRIKKRKTDWSKAQAYVFLHENHKKYFSSHKKIFQPFVLSAGYNTRAGIKKYFQEKYQLTLSVRPPHKKEMIKGKPVLLVNAQILLGEPKFKVFSKGGMREYNELKSKKLLATRFVRTLARRAS